MKLHTAPLSSLTWQDVVDYCDLGLPEGINRDYKAEVPKDLAKTVAAMANTSGGVIVIGVEEDRKSTKPIAPPKGVPMAPGLNEQILNICIGNIAPILVPEVAVVPDPTGAVAVIVLRIPQSHQAPHAISRSTAVYTRRGSISNPEDLATLDELEWLRQGRQKSIAVREGLIARAEDRFWQFVRGFHETRFDRDLERDGMMALSFCPTYPREALRKPPDLQEILFKTRVHDYYRTDEHFPIGPAGGVLVQDGLVTQSSVNGSEWVHHTEINAFGLLFFKQSMLHQVRFDEKTWRVMRASEVFARLDEMFDWAQRVYEQVGYVGSVTFAMKLDNLLGSPLGRYSLAEAEFDLAYCPDNSVLFEASFGTDAFAESKPAIIRDAAQKVAWAYGWNLSEGLLAAYYRKYKGSAVVGS